MKFWISGEVQSDISDKFRAVRKDVQDALNAAIADLDVGPLDMWGFFAIIRDVDSPHYNEVRKYHPKDASLEFRLKIDHDEFASADARGARRLFMAALIRSVQEAAAVAPKELDLKKIRDTMLAVAQSHDWIRQN